MMKLGDIIQARNSKICGEIVGSYILLNDEYIPTMGEITTSGNDNWGYVIKAFGLKQSFFKICFSHYKDDLYYIADKKFLPIKNSVKLDEISNYIKFTYGS